MVHQHGLRHLVRRQRNRFDEQEEDSPVVEMATVVVTMPNTFTGEVIWVTRNQEPAKTSIAEPVEPTRMPDRDPLVRPKPSSVEDDKATPTPTATAGETSDRETSESATATTRASSSRASSSLLVDTSSPPSLTTTGAVGTVAAAITSSAASSTPSAEAASSGMSGGAKAGLALGILVLVGALLGAILFIANRKKKERAGQQLLDNEKASMHNMSPPPIAKDPPPPPPQVISPVVKTQESAPQLSLRPVTQFDPAFPAAKGGSSGGNMLGVAAGIRSPSPDRPSSSWERPGATNATVAPVNPFNDPQPRSNSPPQDPFSNNAAIETSPFPDPPRADFGNPAPAIAAAEKAPATAPLPSPPVMSADNPPPSPAWTDDIPASPGPAPSGPLPVAGAGGASTVPNNVHRIQLDFNPSMADELGLRAGQLVRMLHEYDDGWALCVRLDRSQQGVAPRTCLSKHPVKPRQGPPRQGPPGTPRTRGPMGPNATQPRPLSPASGRSSPHPPSLSPAQGRMSPGPRAMSPGPRQMPPGPRQMSPPQGRARSHSNAPRAGPPRSMSPGPYGGGPQMAPPQKVRPRSNSASQVNARRASPPGPSPMNPNANMHMPARKPIPGQAL